MAEADLVDISVLEQYLQKHNLDKFENNFHFVEKALRSTWDESKQELCEGYLKWCGVQNNVKIIQSVVPNEIFPSGVECNLFDIKVQGDRWGPDDIIYENNKEIRDKVARGNCILLFEKRYDVVIRGFKKFTGGLGDDDDDSSDIASNRDKNAWKKYFTKPIDNATSVTSLSKANGEAAHLSARFINGQMFLFTGSKNVHIVVRNRADVEKYTDRRYDIAKKVTHAVLDFLDNLDGENVMMLLNFLHYTQMTAVLELLQKDYMHVEDLSHLPRNELCFIAWISTDLRGDGIPSNSYCGLPPALGIQVASAFGFKTTNYAEYPVTEAEERMMKIKQQFGYEGEVLYYLDSNQLVIGLVKKKTVWYIILRAIREKAKNMCFKLEKDASADLFSQCITKMKTRLTEIQNWLHLDKPTMAIWQKLGVSFLGWAYHEIKCGKLRRKELDSLFPVVWESFLKTNKLNTVLEQLYGDSLPNPK